MPVYLLVDIFLVVVKLLKPAVGYALCVVEDLFDRHSWTFSRVFDSGSPFVYIWRDWSHVNAVFFAERMEKLANYP